MAKRGAGESAGAVYDRRSEMVIAQIAVCAISVIACAFMGKIIGVEEYG